MCTLDVAFVTLVCCLQVWDMQLKTGAEKKQRKGQDKAGETKQTEGAHLKVSREHQEMVWVCCFAQRKYELLPSRESSNTEGKRNSYLINF